MAEISSSWEACIIRQTAMGDLYKRENILCCRRGGTINSSRHHKYFCQWRVQAGYNRSFLITWLAAMYISWNKGKFIHNKCYWSSVSQAVMLLATKTHNVSGAFRSVYCHTDLNSHDLSSERR